MTLGKASLARRYYHHVLNGGTLTPDNVSHMVRVIEELEGQLVAADEDAERLAGCAEDAMEYAKGRADEDGGLEECDVGFRVDYDTALAALFLHHQRLDTRK